MATILWICQCPSLLVLGLGQISEIARPQGKHTRTVQHQCDPMDGLGIAKLRAGQLGATMGYLISGRSLGKQPHMAPTLTGLPLSGCLRAHKQCLISPENTLHGFIFTFNHSLALLLMFTSETIVSYLEMLN